jgi:hypothetical protein
LPAPGIPGNVVRIVVAGGISAGTWVRHMASMPARPGTPWKFATDQGRWLSADVADDWFREGRVEIVSTLELPG